VGFCSGHKKVVVINGWSFKRGGHMAGSTVSTNHGLKRGPHLNLLTINTQENTGLCHYVISVCKTSVDIKKLILTIDGS